MEIMTFVLNFFQNDYVVNLLSSVIYDAKAILAPRIEIDERLRLELAAVLRNTFRRFYQNNVYQDEQFEFDEDYVLATFSKAFNSHSDLTQKGNVRKAIEFTIDRSVSDEEFVQWVRYFHAYCLEKNYLFKWITSNIGPVQESVYFDDDIVFCRIEAMLRSSRKKSELLPKHVDLIESVFEKINDRYEASWKEEILSIFDKLRPLSKYIEKIQEVKAFSRLNEECDLVFEQLDNLLSMYDEKQSDYEAYQKARKFLKYPRYNMIQIISGTSGMGKSSWIEHYFQYSLEKCQGDSLAVVPVMIPCRAETTTEDIRQLTLSQIRRILGNSMNALPDAATRLNQLGLRICFIIEDIHFALNTGLKWKDIISIMKEYSCFGTFKWMITINEYELYQLETNTPFLQRYCITLSEHGDDGGNSLTRYTISLDKQNREWKVVPNIIYDKLRLDTTDKKLELEKSITTPLEATIFCDCFENDEASMDAIPESYFQFFQTIRAQKQKQLNASEILVDPATIGQIANAVLDTSRCTFSSEGYTSDHLVALRNVQLLVREVESYEDVYSEFYLSEKEYYRLSIMAYWSFVIAGKLPFAYDENIQIINSLPRELSEWLIPCYIFKYAESENDDALLKLLPILNNSALLDYALFLARRTKTYVFSKALSEFILHNSYCIQTARNCYAVLYFVFYSGTFLSIAGKFSLLMMISKLATENEMLDIYENVFKSVVDTSQKIKNLKRAMYCLSMEEIPSINHITGYNTANRFWSLWKKEGKDFERFCSEYIAYLSEHTDLIARIEVASNKSFMDYFIRRFFEGYVLGTSTPIVEIYEMFDELNYSVNGLSGNNQKIIRSFFIRNFTCALGNIFSSIGKKPKDFVLQYIGAAETFAKSKKLYRKLTAWHLLLNSKKEDIQPLDERLQDIADILKNDSEIQNCLGRERLELL